MISVLCPSRGHPELLARSVKSLRYRAVRDIEVLVALDPDDAGSYPDDVYGDALLYVAPERYGYEQLHVYYQDLARIARGDWFLIWGDDCVMMTDGWDEIIESLPEDVFVADLASTYSPLCCFPAVRRRAVDAIGKFSSGNPHLDTFWGDIGSWAGVIQRVGVYVSADSPVRGNPHGFYEDAHQAEMREYAQALIRERVS